MNINEKVNMPFVAEGYEVCPYCGEKVRQEYFENHADMCRLERIRVLICDVDSTPTFVENFVILTTEYAYPVFPPTEDEPWFVATKVNQDGSPDYNARKIVMISRNIDKDHECELLEKLRKFIKGHLNERILRMKSALEELDKANPLWGRERLKPRW